MNLSTTSPKQLARYLHDNGIACTVVSEPDQHSDGEIYITSTNLRVMVSFSYAYLVDIGTRPNDKKHYLPQRDDASFILHDIKSKL